MNRRSEQDGRDNDRDGLVDEPGERRLVDRDVDDERLTDAEARHRLAEQEDYDRAMAARDERTTADGALLTRDKRADDLDERRLATDREVVAGGTVPAATADGVVVDEPVRHPRASGLATLSLILGLAGALCVLTGVLAPLGVALGILGLLTGFGGMSATRRRHVAGRFDATLGVLLSLGTVIVGGLVLADQLSWLSTDTNMVTRLHDWLVAQVPWFDNF